MIDYMKTDRFLTFAVVATMFAACSNENIPVDETKDAPITVTAGVEGMLTRAGYEDTSVLPATFYLSITQDTENASSKYNYTNVLMTKGADNAYTAPASISLLWMGSDRDVAIHAYTTNTESFTVETDQSTTDGVLASDLLGAITVAENSDITIADNNISINFRHLLCKLDVTFSWGTEFDNATTKSIKSVVYNGFGTDAVLDRTTATITPGTNAAAITALIGKTTVDGVEKDMSEAIFAPQVGATPKIVITTSIDNVERVFSLNVTAPTDGFVSGKRYTMGIKIGGTGAEISHVSVKGWTEKPVTGVETEQEAFVYNPATNTYNVYLSRGIQAAIDAAELTGTAENRATVTLLADMEVEGTPNEYGNIEQDILVDGGVIVLDLNGHTLKTANTSQNLVYLKNGATLIVDDSSEEKSGKMITYDKASNVIKAENGKLVINGGTFEGTYVIAGWDNNSTIEIYGGTFIGTNDAVYAQSSILTITGGTFTADGHALYFTSNGKPTITGGSFSGGKYDINTSGLTHFLSYNQETGTGPTFPGGLSIYTKETLGYNLNALLAEGAAYYGADGAKIELDASAASYNGDVTVKKENE